MDFLVFDNHQTALTALNKINENMQLISPSSYALIMERLDGKNVFSKPDDNYMDGVENYTIEQYDPSWFNFDE